MSRLPRTRFSSSLGGPSRLSLTLLAGFLWAGQGPQTPEARRLHADLEFLTSQPLAGRVSLSPQADIAAQYIASEFERCGLQPAADGSYLQKFPLVAYRPDTSIRRLRLIHGTTSKDFHEAPDFTGAFYRDVQLTAPIAFAGYGITAPEYGYDDYAGLDATGKIVLIFDHEPQENDGNSIFNGTGHTLHAGRWMKLANARKHGAIAALIVNDGLHHPAPQPGAGYASMRGSAPPQSLDDPDQVPGYGISEAVAAEFLSPLGRTPLDLEKSIDANLKPQSKSIPGTSAEIRTANLEQRRGVSLNAVGLLEGSDPALKSETVIFTAHYDHLGVLNEHLYPGANDNASGTVAVMELARMFTQAAVKPKRSVLFIVFGSEEENMLGSFYYTAHPLRPLATTRAVINLDMIGRDEAHITQNEGGLQIPADTTNLINLVGSFYSPGLRTILHKQDQSVGLILDTKYDRDHTLNTLFRCDHLPFLIAHIPAVWLFGGFHPGYHEPVDTVDRLNFDKIIKVIQLAYAAGTAVANTPEPPRFEAAPPQAKTR
jgi:hypothetical protein